MSWDDEPRRRADQPWGEADYRRFHDWSDVEGTPGPPQPAQEQPRPALHVVKADESTDPEPETAEREIRVDAGDTFRPDPVVGVKAWAAKMLRLVEYHDHAKRMRGDE